MRNKLLVLNLILFAGISLTAMAGNSWITNFEEAKKAATDRHLPIFAYFSKSDTSKECMRFDAIVLQKPEFQNLASSSLVLFQLDLPRDQQSLPEEIKKRNDALIQNYGISSYPTVLLLNSKGEIIATINYDKGGAEKFVETLRKAIGK